MAGVLANHTEDILMFDVPEPLYVRGPDAYRATWELFFRYNSGGAGAFDVSELVVTAGRDVGFATAILTIFGSSLRLTVGLRREHGNWLIAHEHHSYAIKLDEK
jgi:ketosteroid isomerase-like protein